MAAFSVVLVLFAIALVVMLTALRQIGDAEDEVARLDHAKHAGHQAAALAREQYIHQAHTLLEWNDSHLGHYQEIANEAAAATEHLREMVDDPADRARADMIAELVAESDETFWAEVVPAVGGADRTRVGELHQRTEQLVEHVVELNEELNRSIEHRSDRARERAATIRDRALVAVVACFVLAIAAATAVGFYLMRSISRPVALLRAGAQRIGGGDLASRIALRSDDELGALAGVFNQMAEDLSRRQAELLETHRLASIGQIAAGVAHEINNPLGVILGYVALLRRDAALAGREELTIIEDELRQCQRIVAALLDLARPVRLHRADVDLREVAREAVERLDEAGRLEGVVVRVEDGPRVVVDADEGKLRQVVVNLLTNAVEASRHAGATREVRVIASAGGHRASIEVIDDGPGIAEDARARLFEPFFSTKSSGHGLGLAIARTIARAHGGDVDLEARPEGGVRAFVWVPLRAAEEPT